MSQSKRKKSGIAKNLITAAAVILFVLVFCFAIGNASKGSKDEACERLVETLRRAALSCYASEGIYPPDKEYLTEHYGVVINDEYNVFYEYRGENLMPDITVIAK